MAQQSYKKFVASAATATLVASAIVPVASANVTTSAFTDVPASYKEAVDFVVTNNISNGLTETQYGISQQIKRGDAAVMIASAAGLMDKDAPASGFTDVPTRGALAVNSLKSAGVISGKSATKFGFEDNITRGEAALMLQKAFDLKDNGVGNSFTDVNSRYKAAVDALVANNVTKGVNKTQFGTGNNIKRGDFAKFLFALKDKINIYNLDVESLKANSTTSFDVALKEALPKDADAKELLKVKVVLKDGTVVNPKPTDVKVSDDRKTITVEHKDNDLAGLTGTLTVNGKDLAFDYDTTAAVVSVKAVNANDLSVTVKGGTEDFKASDFEVTVNGTKQSASATKVSATEYKLQLAVPLTDGDVVVVKGTGDVIGSATVTYKTVEVTKVEAIEQVVYTGKNTDGQFLRFKANGVDTTASDLAKQGYEVEFQADAAVFKDTTPGTGKETSKTGEIDALATKTAVTDGAFDYKVTLTKDNKVVSSSYVEVTVIDKELSAQTNAISTVGIATSDIASVTKGKLSTEDTGVKLTKVIADLADGRTGVDLLKLNDADLTVESDDVTILQANVAKSSGSPATVSLTPKKAGKVKLTIKSGTATKVLDLEVVAADRKLTTATLLDAAPKVVDTVSNRTVEVAFKDQFGEAYNTTNIGATPGLNVVQATQNGTALTSTVPADVTAVSGAEAYGYANIDVAFTGNRGTGNLTLQVDSKNVVSIPVSVIAPSTAESYNLAASANKIDLNPTSLDDEVTFTLEKLLSGHFSEDVDLSAVGGPYQVEVLDADGEVIFAKANATTANITITRADLIVEDGTLGNGDADVTDVEDVIANSETGTGLIKVYKPTGELLKSANFSIVDTAPNLKSATLSSGIDFTSTNVNNVLDLGQFITSISTTASAHDSVLRYEVLADPTKVAVYYESSANAPTTSAYSYDGKDVLVGIVQSTVVKSDNPVTDTVTFTAATAPYTAADVTVEATALTKKGDQVQFNVINRGDKTIAKRIYNFVEQK